MYKPFEKEHILIAHRGLRSLFPENTLYAFEASLNKFDMFEFDVQFTKDKRAVVFHDEDLLRVTNAKEIYPGRISYRLSDFTYEELKNLDNITSFILQNPFSKKLNYKFLNSLPKFSIPSLEEVVYLIEKRKIYANLEIKNSVYGKEFIKKEVFSYIKNIKDYVLVSSFNHDYLEMDVYKAALFDKKIEKNINEYINQKSLDAVHVSKEIASHISPEKIKKPVNVYTVNSKKEKENLFKRGFKGVFTDVL